MKGEGDTDRLVVNTGGKPLTMRLANHGWWTEVTAPRGDPHLGSAAPRLWTHPSFPSLSFTLQMGRGEMRGWAPSIHITLPPLLGFPCPVVPSLQRAPGDSPQASPDLQGWPWDQSFISSM